MSGWTPWLVPLAGALLVWACGGEVSDGDRTDSVNADSGAGASCIDGNVRTCTCASRERGTATCHDGRWSACDCERGTCGNGVIEGPELCDGTDLDGESCASVTMQSLPNGTLLCSATCTFDVSGCGVGAGGMPGVGGAVGVGGTTGIGGMAGVGGTFNMGGAGGIPSTGGFGGFDGGYDAPDVSGIPDAGPDGSLGAEGAPGF